ncbi:MAG TPA: hypothetical protein VLA98_06790, partial [Solirubrobacteraceae bacterium]|nr:hypothetical protein [Solirubrobacteraceae bacterium]
RVAAAVPPEGAALAWLHDVLEHAASTLEDLRARGLTDVEAEALSLLTRGGDEGYDLHTLRIAHAPGPAGTLARTVKLADLDDHLAFTDPRDMHAPPYSWARSHVAAVHDRRSRATASAGL